jgi:mannosyltransferase OCH1-like enzyme
MGRSASARFRWIIWTSEKTHRMMTPATYSRIVMRPYPFGRNLSAMIPRIIHQIWVVRDLKEMPARFRESQASWREQNPGWTYILWSEEEIDRLVRDHYPQHYQLFESYPHWIQRVDAGRYMILHHYGGTYSDLDVICRRPFDDFLDHRLVLAKTEPMGVANDLMMVEKGHPFALSLVDGLASAYRRWQRWFVPRHFQVLLTTGPLYVTLAFRRVRGQTGARVLTPEEYGQPGSVNPYVTHVPGNSWAGWDTHVFLFFQHQWKWIAGFAAVAAAAFALR